jgi:acetylglutamate kinase
MTYVIYLDRYHLGDPLFLNRLAGDLAEVEAPKLLVHGAAEHGERLLEGEGGVAVWQEGILVVGSEAEHAIVERATRDVNRQIAHALNEAGVPAVRLDGASRGLLALDDDGLIHIQEGEWLARLVRQHAVPVVAALLAVPGRAMRQVNPGAVVAALATFLDGAAVFLARGPMASDPLPATALPEELLPEPEALATAVARRAHVLLTEPRRLREADIGAVRIRP